MALLFTIYLFVVVALPLTLGLIVSYRGMPRDRHCPQCGNETVQIRTAITRAFALLLPHLGFQMRWCGQCSWEGYARVKQTIVPPVPQIAQSAVPLPARGCRTEALRRLQVGGERWQVLLQCWHEDDLYYGRLLFVGPAGRTWTDAVRPFTGATRSEVRTQAGGLSDGLLTYKLRELASD